MTDQDNALERLDSKRERIRQKISHIYEDPTAEVDFCGPNPESTSTVQNFKQISEGQQLYSKKQIRKAFLKGELEPEAVLREIAEEATVWPYGKCTTDSCSVDTVEFMSDMTGAPEVEKDCPDCGYKLEIKKEFKYSKDLEELPEKLQEKLEVEEQ
jgi:hypothetical protein